MRVQDSVFEITAILVPTGMNLKIEEPSQTTLKHLQIKNSNFNLINNETF